MNYIETSNEMDHVKPASIRNIGDSMRRKVIVVSIATAISGKR